MTKDNIDNKNINTSESDKQTKGGGHKIFVIVIILFIGLGVSGYYFWAELNNAKLALEKISRETSINSATSEKTIANLKDSIAKLNVDQESLTLGPNRQARLRDAIAVQVVKNGELQSTRERVATSILVCLWRCLPT